MLLCSCLPQGSILGPLLFVLMLNDLSDHLRYSRVIKYADDTVIYIADKDLYIVQSNLNRDIESLAEFFDLNQLIINLKKGKTECMLFGTAKRMKDQQLQLLYRGVKVNFVTLYKYLGNILDNTLTLDKNFNSSYKKACGRLMLLRRVRPSLTIKAAQAIYDSMIVPLLKYTGTVHLQYIELQLQKLSSFENRASKILSGNVVHSLHKQIKREACLVVRK